jgi:hypothetical protein
MADKDTARIEAAKAEAARRQAETKRIQQMIKDQRRKGGKGGKGGKAEDKR